MLATSSFDSILDFDSSIILLQLISCFQVHCTLFVFKYNFNIFCFILYVRVVLNLEIFIKEGC
jgi:hypothetical protein